MSTFNKEEVENAAAQMKANQGESAAISGGMVLVFTGSPAEEERITKKITPLGVQMTPSGRVTIFTS